MSVRYAYLHGFASGPNSKKGTRLRARFRALGLDLAVPDLNVPSFQAMTFSGALAELDRMAETSPGTWHLVGSSMGGYLAARWAQLRPDLVKRLVLLCPGFSMTRRWPALVGADGMARWRAHGALTFPDPSGQPAPLHWGFIEDALTHPDVAEPACPTLIIHGRDDQVVPLASSQDFAAGRAHVHLLPVDDDHKLLGSLDLIERETLRFFGLEG